MPDEDSQGLAREELSCMGEETVRDKYINDDEVPLSEFTYTLEVEPKRRKDKTIKLPLVTPLLWIELETRTGENWKALLDTGAAVNLASPAFLERVGARYMGKYAIKVQGASGALLQLDEWYLVGIYINRTIVRIPMLKGVRGGPDCILGLPFIGQYDIVIDARQRIIDTKFGRFVWPENVRTTTIVHPMYNILIEPEAVSEELHTLISNAVIGEEYKVQLKQILIKHKKLFDNRLGHAVGVEHRIELEHNIPVVLAARAIPRKWHADVEKEIEKMLEQDVIEPADGEYCTYPVLIKKKDGECRFAIDYRKLNEITIRDKYPLPRIEELMTAIGKSKYFVLLDMRSGYWQIPVHSAHKKYTAFRCHKGFFRFKRMPFGLVNAPATFQRWVDKLFGKLRNEGVLLYLDDLLIHSDTIEGLFKKLEEVLKILEEAGVQLKASKCVVCPKELKYLGHIVREGERTPQRDRVEALYNIKKPKTLKDIRGVHGVLSFYRAYVPNFSEKILPITKLLKKGIKIEWGDEQKIALKTIIDVLATSVLRLAPSGEVFRLECDASDCALGAVLYDNDEYRKRATPLPIMYLAKTLTEAERNWSTREREAYAILWGLERTDGFVRGRQVKVITDHKNLQWLLNEKNGKLARWSLRLAEYDISIEYRKGSENLIADFLSRHIDDNLFMKDTMFCGMVEEAGGEGGLPERERDDGVEVVIDMDNDVGLPPMPTSSSRGRHGGEESDKEDEVDPETRIKLRQIVEYSYKDIVEPTYAEIVAQQSKELPEVWPKGLCIKNCTYIYLNGVYVPESYRHPLLDALHLLPPLIHPSATKMVSLLRRLYNWPHLYQDVNNYVRTCITCQRLRPGLGITNYTPRTHPIRGPFESLYIDFLGPLKWRGESHILLTMVDHHTKWAEVEAVSSKSAAVVTEVLLDRWIARFGAPKYIINDNDETFVSKVVTQLQLVLGVKGLRITIYHPEGNAPAETLNRTIKKGLSALRGEREEQLTLREAIAWTMMSYRAMPHSSSFDTPAFMTHGCDLVLGESATVLSGFRREDIAERRWEIVNNLRHELVRRATVAREIAVSEQSDKTFEKMHVGDVVIYSLTKRQLERLGQGIGGSKLIPKWSLPNRVCTINKHGTSGIVRCIVTGQLTDVHIERLRRLGKPVTEAMRNHWKQVSLQEGELFRKLEPQRGDSAAQKRKRARLEQGEC